MEQKTGQLVEITQKGQPVIIRNVLVKVCPKCEERVFSKPTAEALSEILTGERAPEGTGALELPV